MSVDSSGKMDMVAYRQSVEADSESNDYGKSITYVEEDYGNLLKTPLEINVVDGDNDFELDAGKSVEIETIFDTPMGH